jgi:Ca2+/Na+ antiporter
MSAGSIVFLLAVVFGLILIVGFMAVHSIDGKLSEIIKILKEKK